MGMQDELDRFNIPKEVRQKYYLGGLAAALILLACFIVLFVNCANKRTEDAQRGAVQNGAIYMAFLKMRLDSAARVVNERFDSATKRTQ